MDPERLTYLVIGLVWMWIAAAVYRAFAIKMSWQPTSLVDRPLAVAIAITLLVIFLTVFTSVVGLNFTPPTQPIQCLP